jgi:hypothetical protein
MKHLMKFIKSFFGVKKQTDVDLSKHLIGVHILHTTKKTRGRR